MTSADPRETCTQCGAPLERDAERCARCEPAGLVGEAVSHDLRIAPERLEGATLVSVDPPVPGAWGRVDDVERDLRDSAVLRLRDLVPAGATEPRVRSGESSEQSVSDGPRGEEPLGGTEESGAGQEREEAAAEHSDPDAAEEDDAPVTIPPVHRPSGPPVLASEALRRELAPAEPGAILVRTLTGVFAVVGVGLAFAVLRSAPAALPVAGGFLALLALVLSPMPFVGRAAALASMAGMGVLATSWLRLSGRFSVADLGLTALVVTLGAALHLRAWHRASDLARVLVAFGLTAGVAWLAAKGSLSDLSTLEADWRAALPRVLQIPFGLLLMVSLLAFMDGRTTGGCTAWAVGLWCWYGGYVGVQLAALLWTTKGWQAEVASGQVVSTLILPLLLPIVGMSLAQLLAHALSRHAATPTESPG